VAFLDKVEKYGTARKATNYNMKWRRKDAICMPEN
jgi:hypothetical protein